MTFQKSIKFSDFHEVVKKNPFNFVFCLDGFEEAKRFRDLSKFLDCIQNVCNKNVCSLWIDIHLLKILYFSEAFIVKKMS